MFVKANKSKMTHKVITRLNNFMYIFNLRQGTILIAIHQITLCFFILIILPVGIFHASDGLSMLKQDMDDDAERRGFYDILNGEHLYLHKQDLVSVNNEIRFANAHERAKATLFMLASATILTALYLFCCISLLIGAIKCKRKFILPWLLAAGLGLVLMIIAAFIGNSYPCIIKLFGGHNLYHLSCALFVLTFLYSICAVSSFFIETVNLVRCSTIDERGERLILLDHAAHSSLLSAAQLNKLSHGTSTQFV